MTRFRRPSHRATGQPDGGSMAPWPAQMGLPARCTWAPPASEARARELPCPAALSCCGARAALLTRGWPASLKRRGSLSSRGRLQSIEVQARRGSSADRLMTMSADDLRGRRAGRLRLTPAACWPSPRAVAGSWGCALVWRRGSAGVCVTALLRGKLGTGACGCPALLLMWTGRGMTARCSGRGLQACPARGREHAPLQGGWLPCAVLLHALASALCLLVGQHQGQASLRGQAGQQPCRRVV